MESSPVHTSIPVLCVQGALLQCVPGWELPVQRPGGEVGTESWGSDLLAVSPGCRPVSPATPPPTPAAAQLRG